jgi:beta-glucosidase
MNVDEKIGQLNLRFLNLNRPIAEDDVRAGQFSAFLYASDPGYINYLQHLAVEESRLHIPLLFGLDVISGYRTIFPAPIALASSWDPDLVASTREIAAREARAAGITWTFAPMVDIARDPRWGRIVEGAGEDPFLGQAMARAQVRGFQGPYLGAPDHVMATAKHFAAYGAAEGGRDYEGASVSEAELWNVYFPPFKAAVDAGVGSIMSAYLDLNDVPATGNRWLLHDVLRSEWGFRGFVVSDAFAVRTLVTHGFAKNNRNAALRAALAGVNMDMEGEIFLHELPDLVAQHRLSMAQLDDMVRPILEAKIRLGLFEHPYVDESKVETVLSAPAHRQAARDAAQRSIVLLKNADGALPLQASRLKKIAVIGPLADSQQDTLGPWTTTADFHETVTALSGIRRAVPEGVEVEYAQGAQIARKFTSEFDVYYRAPVQKQWTDDQAKDEMAKAVALAASSDVAVVVLGEAYNMSGEHASSASLELPGDQEELLEAVAGTGKPVILVLIGGRPLDITWASQNVQAILEAWHPGTQGGAAIADILFGDANPGAKLPITWPRDVGQVPMFYAHNTSMSPQYADRRYWDEESTPLYPFGYGLSYSHFTIANLRLSRMAVKPNGAIDVSAEIRNDSDRKGDDVLQLYIHQRSGSAVRPVRELKGFRRITLGPHERTTVTLRLAAADLRYWSTAERKWVLENGKFDLWVGDDSTAQLHTVFELTP